LISDAGYYLCLARPQIDPLFPSTPLREQLWLSGVEAKSAIQYRIQLYKLLREQLRYSEEK